MCNFNSFIFFTEHLGVRASLSLADVHIKVFDFEMNLQVLQPGRKYATFTAARIELTADHYTAGGHIGPLPFVGTGEFASVSQNYNVYFESACLIATLKSNVNKVQIYFAANYLCCGYRERKIK